MTAKINNQKKVMELIDPSTALMKCKVCGNIQNAVVTTGGRFKQGSWQCRRGCIRLSHSAKKNLQPAKQSSLFSSSGSSVDPDEIGIDRGNYNPSYDHHFYYSGNCGNPSDGD